MQNLLILLAMIFCHIADDYYLQGWLASAKQKTWWKKNAPEKLYQNDYIMALFMHSFSWSFMIMIPIIIYLLVRKISFQEWLIIPYFVNMSIHCIVDNLTANKRQINLIQDQSIHLVQIFVTWMVVMILN